jgi:hypothetical protein
LATYLSYQATEKLKLNARADFGWGSQGVFGYTAAGGNDQLFSLTLTADYSLWANVVSRLEFRWDECLTNDKPFGGTFQNQTPDAKEDFALILNIIYMF